jgi:predicted enzyme related to lactoylglutathione lyase
MIKGLSGTSIWSEDLTKLLPFYRDTLGLPVALETPGFVLLGTNVNEPSIALGTHSDIKGKAKEPQRHIVSLSTDDARAEHQRLSKAGVEFLEEPTDGGQVIFATFKDPEGNYLQLVQFK